MTERSVSLSSPASKRLLRPVLSCATMPRERRVVTVDGVGTVGLESEPLAGPGEGEVLVDVRASGISPGSIASSVAARREDPDPERESRALGYQGAGDVLAVGDGVERLSPGDRVACFGSGYVPHATHATVPVNLCVRLPEGASYAEAAFGNVATTALHAVRRGDVRLGERVAVMGLGLVGQFTAQLAQVAGAHAAGVDTLAGRAALAREAGVERAVAAGEEDPVEAVRAFTDGRGVDCGFVCFGGDATGAVDSLLEMLREVPDGHNCGRVAVVGGARVDHEFPLPFGNADVRPVSRTGPGYKDAAYERGADYPETLVRWPTRENFAEVTRRIADGGVDAGTLLTHRFPLAEADAAYDALLDDPGEAVGVVLEQ